MQKLNFPEFPVRLKNSENKTLIFDSIRKKFVVLQPEEWVRQHCIHFLLNDRKFPLSHINVEKQIKINGTTKRYDIVVFKPNGSIYLIVECKAPHITISQDTFDQVARYNLALKADLLMVTNGINHYYCEMDFIDERYRFLKELPEYKI